MALIAIGGFPGAGKTTICGRLSLEFNLPCLSSDIIGRAIERSPGIKASRIDACRVAYDVLFCLCEEFIQSSASVILDLTLGWDFQWRKVDLGAPKSLEYALCRRHGITENDANSLSAFQQFNHDRRTIHHLDHFLRLSR